MIEYKYELCDGYSIAIKGNKIYILFSGLYTEVRELNFDKPVIIIKTNEIKTNYQMNICYFETNRTENEKLLSTKDENIYLKNYFFNVNSVIFDFLQKYLPVSNLEGKT